MKITPQKGETGKNEVFSRKRANNRENGKASKFENGVEKSWTEFFDSRDGITSLKGRIQYPGIRKLSK